MCVHFLTQIPLRVNGKVIFVLHARHLREQKGATRVRYVGARGHGMKGELAMISHKFSFVLRPDKGKYHWLKNNFLEIKVHWKLQTPLWSNQLKKYTHLSFHKEIWTLSSVSTVKLPLKYHLLNVFKLLESYIFMRESPVMCNDWRSWMIGKQQCFFKFCLCTSQVIKYCSTSCS